MLSSDSSHGGVITSVRRSDNGSLWLRANVFCVAA